MPEALSDVARWETDIFPWILVFRTTETVVNEMSQYDEEVAAAYAIFWFNFLLDSEKKYGQINNCIREWEQLTTSI